LVAAARIVRSCVFPCFWKSSLQASEMMYRISYSKSEEITNPGMDGRTFGFHASYVPMEYLGTPDELGKTLEHRLAVSIAGTTVAIWKLSENDLVKVLFEFARRFLKDALQRGEPFAEFTVKAPMISTGTHPGKCPFDPSRIPLPDGLLRKSKLSNVWASARNFKRHRRRSKRITFCL